MPPSSFSAPPPDNYCTVPNILLKLKQHELRLLKEIEQLINNIKISLFSFIFHFTLLFTGWEVRILGETVPEVLSTALGLRPQTEGTVSLNTDRPRPVNNIFIFFLLRFKSFRKIFLHSPTYVY